MKKEIWKYCREILLALSALYILMNHVIVSAYVPTESMQNTIMPGDRVLGIRFSKSYRRGDIVIFMDPDGSDKYLIKRIIGLPGETLEIKEDGKCCSNVFINGEPLSESYLPEKMDKEELIIKIPEGGYFLMGDNRNQSYDARYWEHQIVFKKQIIGKAMVRLWPFYRIGLLR